MSLTTQSYQSIYLTNLFNSDLFNSDHLSLVIEVTSNDMNIYITQIR